MLVGVDEQIKRLNAARFQLDVMQLPGIIVARTDAEAATFLEGREDERDRVSRSGCRAGDGKGRPRLTVLIYRG